MNGPPGVELAYTEFKQALRQRKIAKVALKGQRISGTYTDSYRTAQAKGEEKGLKKFHTTRPPFDDPELMDLLEKKEVTVRAESQEISFMGGGRGGPFGFGKAPVKRFREGSTGITFNDVAGAEGAKRDL